MRSILIQMDILICAKRTKIIATRTSSGLKIWQKCFGGRGGAPVIAGRPLAGFLEGKMGKKERKNVRKEGEGRRDKKEGEGNRGKGEGGGVPTDQLCPPNL